MTGKHSATTHSSFLPFPSLPSDQQKVTSDFQKQSQKHSTAGIRQWSPT
jgi:hypothetical protein